jgi:ImpA-related N-terminal.
MLHGYAGARDGIRLMKGLHADFWETCYPEIDEGDMEGGRTSSRSSTGRSPSRCARPL